MSAATQHDLERRSDLLVHVYRAHAALAEIETVEDALRIAGFAESVRYAAQQANVGMDAQNAAAEVRLRAERRAGELLAQMEKHDGGRPPGNRSHDATGLGVPPKLSDLGVSKSASSRYQQVADVPEPVFDDYIESAKDDGREITTKRLLRIGREARTENAAPVENVTALPSSIQVQHCDLRDLAVEDGAAALVFTDPPYPGEFLPLWGHLGLLAKHALRPGALLIAYSGQYHLPDTMAALAASLEYIWLGALITPGAHNQVQRRHIRSAVKPLLFYARKPYELGSWFDDAYVSERREKEDHAWQQSYGAARYYIERLTKPGDLIVDPFLGSGTTAVAARDLGRAFVGCDVDERAIAIAKQRLAA